MLWKVKCNLIAGRCAKGLLTGCGLQQTRRCFASATQSRPGVQLNLPPLCTWGKHSEAFVQHAMRYVHRIVGGSPVSTVSLRAGSLSGFFSVGENQPRVPYVMLRLFPDAGFGFSPNRHLGPTRPTNLKNWIERITDIPDKGGVGGLESYAITLECLSALFSQLEAISVPTVLCLPTRLVVSQQFLEDLSSLISSSGKTSVAVELPGNAMLTSSDCDRFMEFGGDHYPLSLLATASKEIFTKIEALSGRPSRFSPLPFHLLYSWAKEQGLSCTNKPWLVVDTIPPRSALKELQNGSNSSLAKPLDLWHAEQMRRNNDALNSMWKSMHEEEQKRSMIATHPLSLSPLNGAGSLVLDTPSEDMKKLILQSVIKEDDCSSPMLHDSDLALFIPDSKKASSETNKAATPLKQKNPSECEVLQSTDSPSHLFYFGEKYWKDLRSLCSFSEVSGFISMPSFYVDQFQQWVREASDCLVLNEGRLIAIQTVPPGLTLTELEHQRLLREGDVKEAPESSRLLPLQRWLPPSIQDELLSSIAGLPAEYLTQVHQEYFAPFCQIRCPHQRPLDDVEIKFPSEDESRGLRIRLSMGHSKRNRLLWLECPSELLKVSAEKSSAVMVLEDQFRRSVTIPALGKVLESWKSGLDPGCAAQLNSTNDDRMDKGKENLSDAHSVCSVMMCIQAPGLNETALDESWSLFSNP